MIRLGLLLLALIAAIALTWATYGEGDLRAERRAAIPETQPETTPTDAPSLIEELTRPEPDQNTGPIVEAESQTAPVTDEFPGPPLQPSPEYEGQTPEPAQTALPAGATGPILYVTATRVNVRAGASTGDAVVVALDRGAAVEALGPTDGDWVQIRDTNGRQGFVSGQFLSSQAPR
ncbi:SH3 domain-containing protein [Paracoccus caeni]|uniref:SH3 domain-containing protein n=1 Tax=Paracoccus caeni TaxID=657651 RepID=A0A934SEE2_9RHOB|nr:SH3 domain-containing protein [Paracoccus caeni]MBK4215845.1 SH3 domain-containing protein [Paracoccus caeni]